MFGMRAGSGAQTCPKGMTGGRLLTPPLRNVTKVLLSINMERENWTFYMYYWHCIYCIQSYFRPLIFSSFLTCKWFRSVLNICWIRQDVVVFKERLFWDIGIRPFFNSSADNEDERGEKNIFLFIWILPHEINTKIWIACNIA